MTYANKHAGKDYFVLTAVDGTRLDRAVLESKSIIFERGLSPADIRLGRFQKTDYDTALKTRQHLANIGSISLHGRFGDDTKPAFESAALQEDGLHVNVGLTNFPYFEQDLLRDPALNLALQEKGLKEHNDRWAYLQQAVGAMGLVVTNEGSVVVRQRKSRFYDGFLNGPAGFLIFDDETAVLDPGTLSVPKNVLRLVRTELGVESHNVVSMSQAGIYGHPVTGEFDIALIVGTELPDAYFEKRPNDERVTLLKKDDLEAIADGKKMEDRNFMYSTWGAMLAHLRRRE